MKSLLGSRNPLSIYPPQIIAYTRLDMSVVLSFFPGQVDKDEVPELNDIEVMAKHDSVDFGHVSPDYRDDE